MPCDEGFLQDRVRGHPLLGIDREWFRDRFDWRMGFSHQLRHAEWLDVSGGTVS
jgi:hypothetical protein